MDKRTLLEAIDQLCDAVIALLSGKIPYQDLVSIRELGSAYKQDNNYMKIFSERLRRNGKVVMPGDRLEFLIVKSNETLLGHKLRLVEEYLESGEEIDYAYYLEKVLINPINQLISIGLNREVKRTMQNGIEFYFLASNRHKRVHLDKPVKMLAQMHQRGHDLIVFRERVRNWLLYYQTLPLPSENSENKPTRIFI